MFQQEKQKFLQQETFVSSNRNCSYLYGKQKALLILFPKSFVILRING